MQKTDEALGRILNQLADKFGTTVEHLYAILLKQAFIEGIKDVVAVFITLVILILAIVITKRSHKSYDHKYNDFWEQNFHLIIIISVASLVFFIVLCVAGGDMIDAFFNPEYYALHQILK